MKKAQVLGILLLLAMLPQGAYADLGDFAEAVETAEAASEPEEGSPDEGPGGRHRDRRDTFGDFLADLFFFYWYANNTLLYYTDYPYYDGGYIRRPYLQYPDMASPPHTKPYWFTLENNGFYLWGIGGGYWLSFRGNIYKFFGPYFDGFFIMDHENTPLWGNPLYGFRAGFQFSLLQFDGFTMAMYLQYQLWAGYLTRNGMTFGLEMKAWPGKPVTLRSKIGLQALDTGIVLGEFELEAGIQYRAWEFFAGYRSWLLEDESIGMSLNWNGPYGGVRYYF